MMRRTLAARGLARVGRRAYHSYPDPAEVPVITTLTAPRGVQQLKKTQDDFRLAEKFKLDKPFPETPQFRPIISSKIPPTISTKLSNGLTVATQEMPGLMASVAFIVKTGSSYETKDSTGATHFLELNAFRTTANRQHMDLIAEVESMGGMVQCIATRENILYCIDFLRPNLSKALDIMAETILAPRFPEEELEDSRMLVDYQKQELPSEVISRDLVQRAAFMGQPLGNPHYCPSELVQDVTAKRLHGFRSKFLFGDNCVVSAAGVEHDEFVRLVSDKFRQLPKGDVKSLVRAHSAYTGGLMVEQCTLKEPFVKLAMAFKVGGWKDDLLVATCVLQQLLGGGKSFSAGGPGKGMYTRLYTQVLNRYYWAEAVEAFIAINDEVGLLGIDGACPPESVPSLVRVIVDQFSTLAHFPVTPEELSRAKNMLKSSMMMQLESRLVVCEDIGRQFITYGAREPAEDICAKIDAVTEKDLMTVASRMLDSAPAISCVGEDVSSVPTFEAIHQFTKSYNHEMWKKAQA